MSEKYKFSFLTKEKRFYLVEEREKEGKKVLMNFFQKKFLIPSRKTTRSLDEIINFLMKKGLTQEEANVFFIHEIFLKDIMIEKYFGFVIRDVYNNAGIRYKLYSLTL